MWRGVISFGMVNIPVRLYVATESHSVSFRQLCGEHMSPIRYKRWCQAGDHEVSPRLTQIAGSLTFTTILSIVPLLSVSFALFTRFPMFRRFEDAIEEYLLKSLLPADIGPTQTLERTSDF